MSYPRIVLATAMSLAMRRPAPARIPLSGFERMQARDYFEVTLKNLKDGKVALITASDKIGVDGILVPTNEDTSNFRINYKNFNDYSISIIHYYGEIKIEYTDPLIFIIRYLVKYPQYALFSEKIARWRYNSHPITSRTRYEILNTVMDLTLEEANETAGIFDSDFGIEHILTRIYGHRWTDHPSNNRLFGHAKLILDSLVISGDLIKPENKNYTYSINAQAVETLERIFIDELRHIDQVKIQNRLNAATWVLGVLTAGLLIVTAMK